MTSPSSDISLSGSPRLIGFHIETRESTVTLNAETAFNSQSYSIEEISDIISHWLHLCDKEGKQPHILCDRRYYLYPVPLDKVRMFLRMIALVKCEKISLEMQEVGLDDQDADLLAKLIESDKIARMDIQKNRMTEVGTSKLQNAQQKHSKCCYLNTNNDISDR